MIERARLTHELGAGRPGAIRWRAETGGRPQPCGPQAGRSLGPICSRVSWLCWRTKAARKRAQDWRWTWPLPLPAPLPPLTWAAPRLRWAAAAGGWSWPGGAALAVAVQWPLPLPLLLLAQRRRPLAAARPSGAHLCGRNWRRFLITILSSVHQSCRRAEQPQTVETGAGRSSEIKAEKLNCWPREWTRANCRPLGRHLTGARSPQNQAQISAHRRAPTTWAPPAKTARANRLI